MIPTIDNINGQYWKDTKTKALNAIYDTLRDIPNLPSREDLEAVPHMGVLDSFRPSQQLQVSNNQSDESFDEQKLVFELIEYTVQKKTNATARGRALGTYVKNAVIHGAPGSGKTFVGKVSMLYAIANGLNVQPTAIQASNAVAIGGVHIHPLLFGIPVLQGQNVGPMRLAKLACQRVMNNPKLLYPPLLTMDVIFLDEIGRMSSELMTVIDVILRTVRRLTELYGGVTILSTLDHTQLYPIGGHPFLCSSHILPCFTFVQLKKSVRAHSDPDLQIIQALAREDPFILRESREKKDLFFQKMRQILTYVPDHNDRRITPNAKVIFSRRRLAKDYIELQTDRNIENLRRHRIRITRLSPLLTPSRDPICQSVESC